MKSLGKSHFSQAQWDNLKALIHKRDGNTCVHCQKQATDLSESWIVSDSSFTLNKLNSSCSECANKCRLDHYPFSFKKVVIPQQEWIESKFPVSRDIRRIQTECIALKSEIQKQIEQLAKKLSKEYKKKINDNVNLWFNIAFIEEDLEISLIKKREFYAKISTLLDERKVIYINYKSADEFVDLINKEYDLLLLEKI